MCRATLVADEGVVLQTLLHPGKVLVRHEALHRARHRLPAPRSALTLEMGVFAPLYPFFTNVQCVRETEILVEQQPPRS